MFEHDNLNIDKAYLWLKCMFIFVSSFSNGVRYLSTITLSFYKISQDVSTWHPGVYQCKDNIKIYGNK